MIGTAPVRVAIVEEGRQGVYERLTQFERRGFIELLWDRRRADRRRATDPVDRERRRQDRRGGPPVVWSSLGFVLLPRRDDGARPLDAALSA